MAKSKISESATMSVQEARAILGVSVNALYRAVQSGQVPSVRIGTRVLIPRAWLQRELSGQSK